MNGIIKCIIGGLKTEQNAICPCLFHPFITRKSPFSNTHEDKDLAPFLYLPNYFGQHIVSIEEVIAGLQDYKLIAPAVYCIIHGVYYFFRRHSVTSYVFQIPSESTVKAVPDAVI